MKCSYISLKKTTFGYGSLLIDMAKSSLTWFSLVLDKRNRATCKKLWSEIKDTKIEKVMTDYWEAYAGFIAKQTLQSKAETSTIEGYNNSLVRHYLVKMKRKTKYFQKV